MDGKPVWIEDKQMPELSGWGIMRDDVCDGYHGVCFIEEYGKRWIAYAYQPAHSDREAWDPCEACKEGTIKINIPEFRALAICNQHMDHEAFTLTLQTRFCPVCGRPLTPEAWAELEKRLRG